MSFHGLTSRNHVYYYIQEKILSFSILTRYNDHLILLHFDHIWPY